MTKIVKNKFCNSCNHLDQKYEFCDKHKFSLKYKEKERYNCDDYLPLPDMSVLLPPPHYGKPHSCDNCNNCKASDRMHCFVCVLHDHYFKDTDRLKDFCCDDWEEF